MSIYPSRWLRQMAFVSICLSAAFSAPNLVAQQLKEEFMASGVTAKTGGYRPIQAEMDQEADIVKVAPDDLKNPQYGKIEIDGKSWAFILDEPEEGGAKLYIDTNGDGDLTNDPKITWEATTRGELTHYSGEGKVELGDDLVGAIGMYRFDPSDERRSALKNTLLFYKDFGYQYSVELDGQEFSTFLAGSPTDETRLPIDRNADGRTSRNFEVVSVGKPFNYTGTTYEFSIDDGKLVLAKSEEDLPQMPLPPDLRVGKSALEFAATTMDGNTVNFPKDYAGKLVMLDMWATWCGPCIGEIPHMKAAYEEHHENGFEILGVSFDSEGMEDKVKEFLTEQELPWAQIYEGKGWETTIGNQHDVSGIPFVLLVDGDSGLILANARDLRGEGLSEFIGQQLEQKNK